MIIKTSHQLIVKEGVYKDARQLFTPMFSTLASQKHNALYTGLDMLNMTLSVAAMNTFVSPAYNSVRNSDTKVEIKDPIWEGLECGQPLDVGQLCCGRCQRRHNDPGHDDRVLQDASVEENRRDVQNRHTDT